MGSYSILTLGRLSLGEIKHGIDPIVMSLFQESDKRVVTMGDQECQDHDESMAVRYESKAYIVQDRLELMGFTLVQSKKAFVESLCKLGEIKEHMLQGYVANHADKNDDYSAHLTAELEIIKKLTFDDWLDGLRVVSNSGLEVWEENNTSVKKSPVLKYIVNPYGEGWYGFPHDDIRYFIRAALETCDTEADLVYDLTELIQGGYFDGNNDICAYADALINNEVPVTQKIIVLTEGVTDKRILEGSLRLLFPHLSDYFTFMDFEGARLGGGAGALANIVKAFIGAGIINRVIAIFDNDTAAKAAMTSLNSISIPPNVAVITYPDIDFATNYPTLGPGGILHMDVNGFAGSIELYLGRDILTQPDGSFMPIQWRGYEDKIQQYQGEIMNKAELSKRFEAKLLKCQSSADQIANYDWSSVRAILDSMRTAFHDTESGES